MQQEFKEMLQIEVAPKVEQLLHDAARARGLKPEVYAGELIEAALVPHASRAKLPADVFLRGMLAFADRTPRLAEEGMSRESFYQDHD